MQLSICDKKQQLLFRGARRLCDSRFSTPFATFVALVGSSGLEPPTSRLSGVCSNLLSYDPVDGGGNRIRTGDPLLAGQVLYQLSYTPNLY